MKTVKENLTFVLLETSKGEEGTIGKKMNIKNLNSIKLSRINKLFKNVFESPSGSWKNKLKTNYSETYPSKIIGF